MSDLVKCERDWQGPSDDECVDDLLVVSCVRRTLNPHTHHIGIVDTPYAPEPDVVTWISGTENLYLLASGGVGTTYRVYRKQFATSDGRYHQ